GLKDRAITRDLQWGIPVTRNGKPRPGFENKVFYVWFDAPIEYIAAGIEWSDATGNNWERWWRNDKGADQAIYVEFMGKDNVPFHTISFPAPLIGSGEPWKLVDRLKAFNWVTWYGGKFSTSQRTGLFMDQALELLPPDYWRWKLMANAPEASDSAFTWEEFQHVINADLVNVFGNFVNRITRFCVSRFDGRVPTEGEPGPREHKLPQKISYRLTDIESLHEQMEFRRAAAATRAIWTIGNEYLQEAAPWSAIKEDVAGAAVAVRTGLNLCRLFAVIALPFVPDTAETILAALGASGNPKWPQDDPAEWLDVLPHGQAIQAPPLLFRRIEDADLEAWAARFGGGASR